MYSADLDKKWLGISIKGINCWQFIVEYYRHELGLFLRPFKRELRSDSDRARLERFLDNYLSTNWKIVDNPKYPDIALFVVKGFRIHSGIIFDDGYMLHMRWKGSCVTKFSDGSVLKKRKFESLVGCYRIIK